MSQENVEIVRRGYRGLERAATSDAASETLTPRYRARHARERSAQTEACTASTRCGVARRSSLRPGRRSGRRQRVHRCRGARGHDVHEPLRGARRRDRGAGSTVTWRLHDPRRAGRADLRSIGTAQEALEAVGLSE